MPIFRRPLMRSTPLDAEDRINFPRSLYDLPALVAKAFYFHPSPGADQSAFFAMSLLSSFSTQSAKRKHSSGHRSPT
jgi:hypothetical protein